jgi:hypothetical protein
MDLTAISNLAMKLARQMVEEKLEERNQEIEMLKRAIKRDKNILKVFDAFAKEMAKPPKPFQFPKLTKAQKKQQAELRKRYGMPVMPTAPAVQ